MEEIWKDIIGYEGLYQISNYGEVKSLPKTWLSGKNNIKKHNGIVLKNGKSRQYLNVNLRIGKIKKTLKPHRLVAIHFIDNPNNYECVDHIDGNKHNNNVYNLRWCTIRENSSFNNRNVNKTSKYTGVCWYKRLNKWQAQAEINGKKVYIGLYKTEEEAHEAYLNAISTF
jgi:NUMOD4 motif/HNH endonuclease/AP2 domain